MPDDDAGIVALLRGHAEIMERDKGKFIRFIDAADCVEAANRIEAQAAEIEQWRSCALYDATMEGPVFRGWDRSALDRCRRAALKENEMSEIERGEVSE